MPKTKIISGIITYYDDSRLLNEWLNGTLDLNDARLDAEKYVNIIDWKPTGKHPAMLCDDIVHALALDVVEEIIGKLE